jgi:aspartate racemase
MAFRFVGSLDVAALEHAFNEILRRHDVLRTTFAVVNDEPVQIIAPPVPLTLDVRLMPGSDDTGRRAEAMSFAVGEASAPFDLGQGPLLRFHLLRVNTVEHLLLIVIHHSIFDGWSVGVFLDELRSLYGAFMKSLPSPLEDPPIQYGDFAVWQRGYLSGTVLDRQLEYWKSRLAGCAGVLELPGDRLASSARSGRGGDHRVTYPEALSHGLRQLSRDNGVTLFMTLAAAFGVFLHRMTGSDDILMGTPVAGRARPDLERLIGFFVNTLVLRADLSGDPLFPDLLHRVRETALGAFANQDLPFERLVGELHPERVPGRSPLIQVMFALQNAPASGLEFPGLAVTGVELSSGTSKFDLTLTMTDAPGGLEASFEYAADLFEPATIDRMAERFRVLLEGIVGEPSRRISELPLMTPEESHRVLVEWNNVQPGTGSGPCIDEVFEDLAAHHPESVAVSFRDEQLSYGELNLRANRLAHYLRSLGVGPEVPVGVCMERSPGMIVALLAILKAGGAFVPLDPGYPRDRLKEMIADTTLTLVVTESRLEGVPFGPGVRRVCCDTDRETIDRSDGTNLRHGPAGTDPAYIMFTSGSTGRPKGIVITHRAIASHCRVCGEMYGIGPRDRVLQFASLSFDPSVEQIFTALTAGARLVLRGEEFWSAKELYGQIVAEGLTVVNLPTAYWHEVVMDLPGPDQPPPGHSLRLMIVGGEAMLPGALRQWRRSSFGAVRLLNAYGPTETTVTSLLFDCTNLPAETPGTLTRVPIGRPLRNRSIYILDPHGRPAPAGFPGELHIGGPALARGYLNQPELTAERFVRNHIDSREGSLLYKTGDIVRFDSGGNLEFLGRVDRQEKIRGYRVEPGEIESVLREQRGVHDVAVVVRDGPSGEKQIVAYCVGERGESVAVEDLMAHAAKKLPAYMLPSAIVMVERLPLTANGKIDRGALPPPPEAPGRPAGSYVAPRDPLEARLAGLWESLLGKKPIGVYDNFFELGGHSLLAARLFARIEKLTGKNLPLSTLFQEPTIDGISAFLRRGGETASWSSLVAIKPGGSRSPFFCVHAAGGNVLGYQSLASRLDPDQPVYGLQAKGLNGKDLPLESVEEMAALYIQEIRALQPGGPYYLGGACTGGILAYEMAQQLVGAGEEVGILAMFDTFAHSHLKSLSRSEFRRFKLASAGERLRYHAGNLFLRRGRIVYVRRKSKTLVRRFRKLLWGLRQKAFTRLKRPLPRSFQRVEDYTMQAIVRYLPRPYPGRITLFPPSLRSVGEFPDPEQGWGSLALGGVEVHDVTGDHLTMLSEPYVAVVAQKLTECIHRSQDQGSTSGVSHGNGR